MVTVPVNRATRWRIDKSAVPDYNDNSLFCGGFATQWEVNGGKCGLCGDSYSDPTPRTHELGGTYGDGIIVQSYTQGSTMAVTVKITANHKGYFEFNLCNLDKFNSESDECFADISLADINGSYKTYISTELGEHYANLKLPDGLVCEHCVLQWTYTTGNRWGYCADGTGANGCGPQETFRTCSDIAITP